MPFAKTADMLKAANQAHTAKQGKKSAFKLRGAAMQMYKKMTEPQLFKFITDTGKALKEE